MDLEQREIQPETNFNLPDPATVNRLSLMPRILKASAAVMGVPFELVNSDARTKRAVYARFIAMFIAHTYYNMSKSLIGRRIKDRDHTTVVHGIRRVEKMMAADPVFAAKVNEVRSVIAGSTLMPIMVTMEELASMPEPKKKVRVRVQPPQKRLRERPKAEKEPGPTLCFTDEDVRRVTECLADRLRSYHPEMEDKRVVVRMRAVA